MNQLFTASIALLISIGLWSLGKKNKTWLLTFISKASLENNSPKSQVTLVEQTKRYEERLFRDKISKTNAIWEKPKTPQERLKLEKSLKKLISLGPEERLKAVDIAGEWGHKLTLPILRRGIKDSDSRVVIATAKALEKYKKATIHSPQEASDLRPPRNVALMR